MTASTTANAEAWRQAVRILERLRLIGLGWFMLGTLLMVAGRRPTLVIELAEYASFPAFCALVAVVLDRWRHAHAPTPHAREVSLAWRAIQVASVASLLAFGGIVVLYGSELPPRATATLVALCQVCIVASRLAFAVGATAFLWSVVIGGAEVGRRHVQVFARFAIVFVLVVTLLHTLGVLQLVSSDVIVSIFLLSALGIICFFVATRGLQLALHVLASGE